MNKLTDRNLIQFCSPPRINITFLVLNTLYFTGIGRFVLLQQKKTADSTRQIIVCDAGFYIQKTAIVSAWGLLLENWLDASLIYALPNRHSFLYLTTVWYLNYNSSLMAPLLRMNNLWHLSLPNTCSSTDTYSLTKPMGTKA